MNNINYKVFPILVAFTLIISNNSYCNDGGEYYWGPEEIKTVEEKIVNINGKKLEVYKGAGDNFEIDERAIVPNGIKVNVYATITNGNTKWSLIKYFYYKNSILSFIRDDEMNSFEDDYSALEYFNKLSEMKQYEKLSEDAFHVSGKDFGWVKDKYLISEQELQEKYKNIFESQMSEIVSRNESIEETTKENIIYEETNNDKNNKKDNIFDIIKKFFGL